MNSTVAELELSNIGSTESKSLTPHTCFLTLVPVPNGIDPSCSYPKFLTECRDEESCTNCSLFALELDCEGCWVENITFAFNPQDECFWACGMVDVPTQPSWVAAPERRSCAKVEAPLHSSTPLQGSWVNGTTAVFKICRSSIGPRAIQYSAAVYCPDPCETCIPPPGPVFHGNITGSVTLP